ncbi:MAG: carbohydrate kinase family protein [Xanthomonadales bacterium]|nr:carbohydrate kinase family protein [Xanthomonadales bacterium]
MSALICGSLAYDTIMVFPDRFQEHILPDKLHMLNVAFLVPEMRREFGGVAGNIVYNINLLGTKAYPMATVGEDFTPYQQRFEKLGIPLDYVQIIEDQFTPQAFITTDLDGNQITAFHPGAMMFSTRNRILDAGGDISIGLVGPDSREGMIQHSQQFADRGIPHIFDLGQAMPLFQGDDLVEFIDRAQWVIVNDYEAEVVQERTDLSANQIAAQLDAYIVTHGANGSTIYTREGSTSISTPKVDKVIDPTGCGDAYRAGLIHGLLNNMDLPTSCRLGSLLGSIKIRHQGPQNHKFSMPEFEEMFFKAFGYRF